MIKALFLFLPLFLYSQCTYNMDINFDLKNNTLVSKIMIKDKSKNINIFFDNFDNFDIKNKELLYQKINQGSREISFSYKKTIKEINSEFIYLLNDWYPRVDGLCSYNIKTNLPPSYKIVKENSSKLIKQVTFIASQKYIISSKNYNNIKISTYFFNKDKKQVKKYLNKTIEYIKMYEEVLGKFPYKNFSIVENYTITGYSMPTYTLVGSYILKKDYFLNRSLGHEILHQYFGNSVFNNNLKGNYSEGLVTHLADNYYARQIKEGAKKRKEDLISFMNFANNDYAPKNFIYKKNKNSSVIGYTKISFIFYMLENKLGKKRFNEILKRFYKEKAFSIINLKELRSYFNKHTKEDLKEFFHQWFDKKGMIDFTITNVKRLYDKDGFYLSFTLKQKNEYSFFLPISINIFDGNINKKILINKKIQKISIKLEEEPLSFVLDKEYKLFRALKKSEYPLNIGSLLNSKNLIIIKDEKTFKKYKNISKIFPKAKIIRYQDLKFEILKKSSVLFLDKSNQVLKHFLPRLKIDENKSFLTLKEHAYNDEEVFAILNVNKKINRSFFMLKHYASYKKIILNKNEVIKILDKKNMGYKIVLNSAPIISIIKKEKTLNEIYEELKDKKIIYVGESHTNMSHHINQLRVIKSVYKKDKKLAIAMEMFQQKFQKDINAYINSEINEDEFLKRTEYFKRWKFNYTYYKAIIDFAKKNKIPVIALNTSRKIIKEVSKNGILAFKNKNQLPTLIDQSDLLYKKSLMKVYAEHDFSKNNIIKKDEELDENKLQDILNQQELKKDYFFQSQIIWDETMASNIVKFMKNNKKYTLVVIAGSGHIAGHSGIPKRVYQDTKLAYKIILNDAQTALVDDIIINNKSEIKIKDSLKLGVYLENEKSIKIQKILLNSNAEKFSLKKNDIILKVNGQKIENLSDLKRVLYYLKDFSDVRLHIKRDGQIKLLKFKTTTII